MLLRMKIAARRDFDSCSVDVGQLELISAIMYVVPELVQKFEIVRLNITVSSDLFSARTEIARLAKSLLCTVESHNTSQYFP